MITALAGALLAGALTTLAPCSLTLLPVIVGGSLQGATNRDATRRAIIITLSLGASVMAFTLLLRATTALIGIPTQAWQLVSGILLITLGLFSVFPGAWDRITHRSGLTGTSARNLDAAHRRGGTLGAILTGAALGPVFTSCSPLFAYVIVTVLPAEPGRGLALLTVYTIGLMAVLLAIALAGQRAVSKMRWAANPHGWFRRGLGILFIVIGILIATGVMQDIEAWILTYSPIAPWEIGSDLGR
ncbi:cytochrome c biogenesis CcdA family protein [Microbacterium sp. ZOR0019]|uniref:cytochrome c biogenesis CcdA family protein n=1 Tax=Microbacterium sp. ZOR0019 TaxID=1339233 RepID=UPI000645C38C|nr:cytochrome c biogenesis protein CcdA [Microbacterium sp. ZOR0019]